MEANGAVRVKPRLCGRPQNVGDARAVGYLPRRTAPQVWSQHTERSVIQSTRLKDVGVRRPV